MPLVESDFPELYRLLIDNLEDLAVFLIDPEGRIASWNPGVERNLGYSEAEFLGRDIAILFTPEDTAAGTPVEERATARQDGRAPDRRWHMRKDGTRLFVDGVLVALKQPGDGLIGYAKIMRDITAQHRAQVRLEDSERRLRLATEAAGAGIWSLDTLRGSLEWSPQCKRLFGLDPGAEISGYEKFLSLVHPEDRDAVDEAVRRAAQNSADYNFEFRTLWPDGSVRHLMARGVAHAGNGEGARITGVVFDVTERKRAETAAREQHRLESIGMLAGGIAHEFNNLLTGIIGNGSLIAEVTPAGSESADRVEDLLRAADRAAELTRQLLAYSGRGRFTLDRLDVSAQVSEISGLLHASLPKKVRLNLELAPGLPAVEADRMQIRQAVVDLVANAGEAIGDAPGTVTVTTSARDLDEAAIQQEIPDANIGPGRFVMLTVRDTGSGMAENVRARIFEPFFTTKFLGRGLGLPAVQGVVRGHGGGIAVDSAPGKGTVMKLYLPAAGEVAKLREAPAAAPNAGRRVVLVVDDEDMVRKVARAALEKRGYTVITAEDGEAAVRAFSEQAGNIAAVLMDMTMPVMGGEEATARIRRIRPDVPVIASSGYSRSEAMERFGPQVSAYIQKPYTAGKLGTAVEALVKGK